MLISNHVLMAQTFQGLAHLRNKGKKLYFRSINTNAH